MLGNNVKKSNKRACQEKLTEGLIRSRKELEHSTKKRQRFVFLSFNPLDEQLQVTDPTIALNSYFFKASFTHAAKHTLVKLTIVPILYLVK
jgi:hypothetical protein